MHDREYERLRKQIEEEYRANLDALERIWKMSKKQGASGATNGRRGSLLGAVRQATAEKHSTFNLRDIEDTVKRQHPDLIVQRASLSSSLLRLVSEGELEIVEKGTGRMPSIYRHKAKTG